MSNEWDVQFHMGEREDEQKPCSPFTYLEEAINRKSPQSFFVTASRLLDDPDYKAYPIVAIVQEKVTHTRAERRQFLDNIVVMLELMEAQRDVDRN